MYNAVKEFLPKILERHNEANHTSLEPKDITNWKDLVNEAYALGGIELTIAIPLLKFLDNNTMHFD
jgi:hypothetical protein